MLLKIQVQCPLCANQPEWIYDTEKERLHRGAIGCPGGCTTIYEIRVDEISKEDAQKFLNDQVHPTNNLDYLMNDQ